MPDGVQIRSATGGQVRTLRGPKPCRPHRPRLIWRRRPLDRRQHAHPGPRPRARRHHLPAVCGRLRNREAATRNLKTRATHRTMIACKPRRVFPGEYISAGAQGSRRYGKVEVSDRGQAFSGGDLTSSTSFLLRNTRRAAARVILLYSLSRSQAPRKNACTSCQAHSHGAQPLLHPQAWDPVACAGRPGE